MSVSSPVANLNPGSVTFPNTIVNSAAAIQKVQLQNTGTSALTITSIVPTGTDAANYSYTADAVQPCPMSPSSLGNGATCLLDIGFLPLTAGTHNNAQITVTDNSGNVAGSTQTVALSGTGIVLSSIAVTPAPVTITQGSTQQFTATGTYSDSSTQNLTNAVTWASATTSVATINAAGLAQGVSPGTSNITAKQGSVTSPAAVLTVTGATHFAVSAPGIATAGNAITVTVTALDQFNSQVPGYTGTVHFTSSDAQAVLPANSTLTNGTGTFQVTLKTLGSETVTATDTVTGTITGTSGSITVGSGLATHFLVAGSPSVTAGTAFSLAVEAVDQFNNLVTTYTGTVHFTSTDGAAVLPANSTLTSGAGVFQVTLKTLGSETVTATDTVTSTITGTSNTITVGSGVATHFAVAATLVATAGTPTSVTVAALDQFGNLVSTYAGTVHFTSTDPLAVLPVNSTLTNGAAVFQVTLKTLGSQTVTATDTVTAAITGTSNTITVGSGVTTHFGVVASPPTTAAGTPVTVTVGAVDQFNNLVTTYAGTVHFTSTDPLAVLPVNSALTNGAAAFQVTLKTVGTQTVTATDTVNASITGTSNTVSVTAATLQNIAVTPANPSIAKGLTQQFAATGMFSDGSLVDLTTQVTWNSATTTVATINATGLATAVNTGTSNITASLLGVTSPIDVLTVTAAVLQSITVTPGTPTVAAGQTLQFTATGHFSDGTTGATSVNWTSADTTIATVNSSGLAAGVKAGGPVTITATSTSNAAIFGNASLMVAPPIGFALTGSLSNARRLSTATLLNDGRVLVVGGDGPRVFLSSAELYNPSAGTFATTGSLTTARVFQTATLLNDGRVLIAGGNGGTFVQAAALASAEFYDPKTGAFSPAGSMATARFGQTATLLNDGRVLITGGNNSSNTAGPTAEVFNPVTGTFSAAGTMTAARAGHTATLLNNGTVLIAGSGPTAEIYNPNTGTFTATGSLLADRSNHTATLLDDGTVLIAGGLDVNFNSLSSAELYNPATGTFTATGSMTVGRALDTATLLNNGTVLFVGGFIFTSASQLVLPSAEVYDPIAKTFTATGSLNFSRGSHNATLLLNGKVLVVGGDNVQSDGVTFSGTELATAELYTPSTLTQPGLTSISVTPATPSIPLGTFQGFTATGIFNGGGQQTLDSVTWSSSNTADVSITNDATNSGRAFALAAGNVTITACEGAVCGSTGASVPATLQSITVAPTTASVAAGLTQPFAATGHFSDGTTARSA